MPTAHYVVLAEWLTRWTANPFPFGSAGSNPADDVRSGAAELRPLVGFCSDFPRYYYFCLILFYSFDFSHSRLFFILSIFHSFFFSCKLRIQLPFYLCSVRTAPSKVTYSYSHILSESRMHPSLLTPTLFRRGWGLQRSVASANIMISPNIYLHLPQMSLTSF